MRGAPIARRLLVASLWGLGALLLFASVATLRAVLDGEREIAQSDSAFDGGDLHAAIQHARRAASAYAPRAPHVQRGYDRLRAVARGAEANGQADVAMLAWQAERAAVLESASLWQPFPERLEEANRNLARLTALQTGAEPERAEVAKRLFKAAQSRDPERWPLGALLAVGLLVAAFGVAWFARSALAPGGRIAWLAGRWGIVTFALGVALWAFAAFHG
jgi:cobalamin biosynthesis Mg chelatase CobN